jgi:hypothetical protein
LDETAKSEVDDEGTVTFEVSFEVNDEVTVEV